MTDLVIGVRIKADGSGLTAELVNSGKALGAFGAASQDAGQRANAGMSAARRGIDSISQQLARVRQEVLGFGTAFLSIQGARQLAAITDEYSNLQGRLKLVTTDSAQLARVQSELFRVAQDSSTAYADVAQLYTRVAQNSKELGVSQQQLIDFTETTSKAFQVSGASAAESSGAIRQLTQSLASGVLRGEEFNSVAEQGPRIMQALSDSLGKTRGELRAMAEEGELTSQIVFGALEEQSQRIADEYSQLPLTIGRAWTQIGNSVTAYIGEADQAEGSSRAVAEAMSLLARNLDTVAGTAAVGVLAALAVGSGRLGASVASQTAEWVRNVAAQRASTIAAASLAATTLGAARAAETAAAAELGKARATVASVAAEVQLEKVRLAAQISEQGRVATINRMAAASLTLANAQRALATAEAQLAGATAATAAASTSAAAAMTATTLAARASAAGAKVLAGGLALVGGPAGAAVVAGLGLIYFITQMESSEERSKRLSTRLRELSGDLEGLGRAAAVEELEQTQQRISIVDGAIGRLQAKLIANNNSSRGLLGDLIDASAADKLKAYADERAKLIGIETALTAQLNGSAAATEGVATAADTATEASKELADARKKANEGAAEQIKVLDRTRELIADGVSADEAAKRAKLELDGVERAKIDTLIASERAIRDHNEGLKASVSAGEEAKKKALEVAEATQKYTQSLIDKEAAANASLSDKLGDVDALREQLTLVQQGATAEDARNQVIVQRLQLRAAELQAAGQDQAASELLAQVESIRLQKKIDGIEDVRSAAADAVDEFFALDVGGDFAAGFDDASASLGTFVDRFGDLAELYAAFDAAKLKGFEDAAEQARAEQEFQKGQIKLYGDLAGSAKGFFKEGSSGYKTLEKAERGFRAIEIALAAQSLAAKLFAINTATGASVASQAVHVGVETVKATASGIAAAASSMVGLPFPANLAALAATVAALVGIGVALNGGGGGGGGGYNPSAAASGRGTVLGDSDAQSESVGNSLDRLTDLADEQLDVSRSQLLTLRAIEQGFKTTAGAVARAIETSRVDNIQRVDIAAGQTIGGVASGGLQASFARDATGGELFRAIFNGDRAQLEQLLAGVREDVDSLIARSIGGVFEGIVDTLSSSASALGLGGQDLRQRIEAIDLTLDSIDLRDLSGDEIIERISAVFSAVGDEAVRVLLPAVAQYQQINEGLLETLVRVSSQVQVMEGAFEDLGIASGGDAQSRIRTSEALVSAAGGLDLFAENLSGLLDLVLTDQQQFVRLQRQVTEALGEANVVLPRTRDELAQYVATLHSSHDPHQAAITVISSLSDELDDYYSQVEAREEERQDLLSGVTDRIEELTVPADKLAKIRLDREFALLFDEARRLDLDSTVISQLYDLELAALSAGGAVADFTRERLAFDTRISTGIARQGLSGEGLEQFDLAQRYEADLAEAKRIGADINAVETFYAAERLRIVETYADRTLAAAATERAGLERQLLEVMGDTAALRALDRAALDESNRALFDQVNALRDSQAAAAAATAAESELAAQRERVTSERLGLERQLLEVLGDTGALRALDRAALDESNRALFDQVNALRDQQAATAAATAAESELAEQRERVTSERLGLERQLLEVLGDTAALRALDRAALDESNRALFDQVNALRDSQAAAAASAAAESELASQRERVTSERLGLERQLLEVLGDTAALRALDRAALDESNRALFDQVNALRDSQAAAQASAAAESELAAQRERVNSERLGLERQLLEVLGDTAALRALDRAALDESNRALFDQVNALRDSQAAAQASAAAESELAAQRERVTSERMGLERQLLELQGDTAALRALDRAALDESNRALFDQVNALRDSQAAAQASAAAESELAAQRERVTSERLGLERQLLEVLGDTAALRALDRAALDESNRALFDQVQALRDSQAAATAATAAESELAAQRERVTSERLGLERQLLEVLGDTAALRALDRTALDESNRALFDQVQALRDSQAATAASAAAESELAAQRERVTSERLGLERQLLEVLGDTAALRALDRAALDESNRALFDQVQGLRDSQAAAQASAAAESELAAQRERVTSERLGLERQLLEVLGDTAALRALDRAALDESNRALFDQVQALRDSQNAAEAAAQAETELADLRVRNIEEATQALREAYGRQANELQATVDRFDSIAGDLRAFRADLLGADTGRATPQVRLNALRSQLDTLSPLAALGDEDAIGKIRDLGQQFIDASLAVNSSSAAYFADRDYLVSLVDSAIGGAEIERNIAQEQLDVLTEQVAALITIEEAVLSVADAIANLGFAQAQTPAAFATGGAFTNGVVTRPTLFPLGQMGEAGPEAILPLSRNADGSLGVRSSGSGNADELKELRKLVRHLEASVRLDQDVGQKTIAVLERIERRMDDLEEQIRHTAKA